MPTTFPYVEVATARSSRPTKSPSTLARCRPGLPTMGDEGWTEGLKKRPGTVISLKGEAAMPGLASRL
jgi:hypothetical protein